MSYHSNLNLHYSASFSFFCSCVILREKIFSTAVKMRDTILTTGELRQMEVRRRRRKKGRESKGKKGKGSEKKKKKSEGEAKVGMELFLWLS